MEQRDYSNKEGNIVNEGLKEPRRYCVYILNDDFTTFEFVISVVMTVFFKTQAEANTIAAVTHVKGKALVGVYSYDIAHSKVAKAVAMARRENFPLRFKVEPYNGSVEK